MACQIKSMGIAGKQDVPNVLWIGVRDGDPGPIMVAREKPEAFKLKFRAWMFPHNFFVKEIEFWSGYNWGTIKLESAHARTVLLEHAKYHPFKPFTDGEPWEIRRFQKTVHQSQLSVSSTESLMGDISKSIKETNQQSKPAVAVSSKQPQKSNETNKQQNHFQALRQKREQQSIIMAMKSSSMSPTNETNEQQKTSSGSNKNIQAMRQRREQQSIIMAMKSSSMSPDKQQKSSSGSNKNTQALRQKQEQQSIIMAMKGSSMSPKTVLTPAGASGKKNKVIDNIKKSTTTSNNDVKETRTSATSSPTPSQKQQSASPKNKTPELHFNYKKPRQYQVADANQDEKDESVGRRSRERQRRKSESMEKKEGINNEVLSDKRLQHQLVFTNGSRDVVNELFKEIRSTTASPSDTNRSQLQDQMTKDILDKMTHPKNRLGKHSMGFTVGTYPGEKKKILPRSSSPVLKTHQGASSRVMKGLPCLPDISAVVEQLAKSSSQQKKTGKEESGILNIENEAPKSFNKHFLPRKVEQQIVLDRVANAFMATENQSATVSNKTVSSKQKSTDAKNPTPPSSPVKASSKLLDTSDISTPSNMTREKFETAVTNLRRFFIWSSMRNNVSTNDEKQFEAENRFQDLLRQLKNSEGSERQMLLKHNLTVASDVMSACSTNEYSTPNEIDQERKTANVDKVLQEDPPCKTQPRIGPVQSVGQNNQVLAMAASNEQAYREMLTLLHNESKITEELAPIDGDTDDMHTDGRMTADSLCSSALLLLADPDQDSMIDSEQRTVISRGFPEISQGETPVSMGYTIAQELLEQLSSEDLKTQLDQQHDLAKKLCFLKLQQTAETVAHMQKGISGFAMRPKPSQQTSNANTEINHELEEKIANITKLVHAEIEEEKLRKRQQGVLVEEHGTSMDVDEAKTLIPVTLQSLLHYSKWVKKEGMDTSETLYMKILKGMKPPKNMDRWKGMESWLRIHYFDHLEAFSKRSEEGTCQKEDESCSLLHARFVVCILNGAGATPVGLEADLEVYVGRGNGKNDGRRGLDKFCRELAEQIEKHLSHPHETTSIMDGSSKASTGKSDNKLDPKSSTDITQTLSLFLEVPNLRDCVSISTVVHATVAYLFSRHFPAFSVPRPILKALRTVPYISHKTGSVYQCAGIVSGYVNSVEIDEFFKSSEPNNPCVEDYLKLEDKIGIISSPRGRVLFGPANIWNKDIEIKRASIDPDSNANSKEVSKPDSSLPNILPIGQVVLFDAICVIDTAASAVSKSTAGPNKEGKRGDEKCSQINTNIEVKKVIYMIGTKITKIDDCKMGGIGLDIVGFAKPTEKSYNEIYTPTLIVEGCDDCSFERSICVGGGQIETTFENSYKTELRQRCTNIVMNAGPETFRPNVSSAVHSSSSSEGFWIPSDSFIFSKELNKEIEGINESHRNKFDIMDLPIDEEISQTYAQTIVVEHNKLTTSQDLEPNSSSFVSLFKVELLLAASAASEELFDSEDELTYKRRIGPSSVLQDKEAIYFANHYASIWARLGYSCAELFQDYLTLCSLGSQGCVLFHWSNLLSRFRFPRCLHRSVLINVTAKIFERQMDTVTSHDDNCASPNNLATFSNSERFKYNLDNPVTLKSLSNIRAVLDQHTNFLMGLAATSSLSLKNDLTHLSTIPTLFILQRLFVPLRLHQALPEPVSKGRYSVKIEMKNDPIPKSNIVEPAEVSYDINKEEVIKVHDVCSIPTPSIIKTPEKRHTQEVRREDIIKSHDTPSSVLGTSLTKPSSKAVAFYAEVDQEVEEIRKRLLAASPQPCAPQLYASQPYAPQPCAPQPYAPQPYAPQSYAPQSYATSLVNGTSNETNIGVGEYQPLRESGGNTVMPNLGNDNKSPAKSSALIKPNISFREAVRIQHGTDVLTFETDSEGNVPVAKIDAVLSHVVALKYRLPHSEMFDSMSPTHRPHSREGYFADTDSTISDSSNICWRIVNKEGDVFRKPQEGWGANRVYIPVTAPKAPIHSQGRISPVPVRPFQPQQHITFQDQLPLKVSEHSLGGSGYGSRVGSALGMVNTGMSSPTDCHASQTSHSQHTVGLFSSAGNITSSAALPPTSGSTLSHHQLPHHRVNQHSVHFSKPY